MEPQPWGSVAAAARTSDSRGQILGPFSIRGPLLNQIARVPRTPHSALENLWLLASGGDGDGFMLIDGTRASGQAFEPDQGLCRKDQVLGRAVPNT